MSQSPPNMFYNNHKKDTAFTDKPAGDYKSSTLPKDLTKKTDKNGNSSPTLSVKSLNVKPSSPRLGRIRFGSSPSNMDRMNETIKKESHAVLGKVQYLVAVHR